DRYFAEILWHAWCDLNRMAHRAFEGSVKLRAGMSVGKALQGPAGDNIINNEETLIGPDCNLAARLVNEALEMNDRGEFVFPGGTLFTIDSQRRKVEHLVRPAPAVKTARLKGFSQPVELFGLDERQEVESVAQFIERLRKVPLVTEEGHVVRFVSQMRRSRYLARCLDVIEAAASGERDKPQLLAFIATSGVGKTRRIAEVAHWALTRNWTVYFGECYSWYGGGNTGAIESSRQEAEQTESHSDEGAYPYYPFIRILKEQVFRIDNQDSPELRLKKVAEHLAALNPADPDLAVQAPVIAAFIGVEVPDNDFCAALDAEERRNIFYERTADIFLKALNSQGPGGIVLLCIDDLQWADRNSLHLLSYVLKRAGRGLVAAVNARKPSQLGILRDKALPVDRTELKPGLLKTAAVEKLTNLVLGIDQDAKSGGLPAEMRDRVVRELERNPFFVLEFCTKLLEQEIITVADGACTRFDAENFRSVSIPTRIQGIIEDRISRLPKAEHAAIQFSSVLGNILRYIIIRRFLPAVDRDNLFTAGSLDEIFSRLTGQEITRLENEKDPDWVYTFKRALIGEKLYQELVPSLRKRLHGEVAKIFEITELANRFEKALLTALHYSNAEVPDKSCSYYLEAGRLAREVFDNQRCLMLFEKIEKILAEYRVADAQSKRMVLLEERGQVNMLLARYDPALEDFQALATIAVERKKPALAARARYLIGRAYFERAGTGDFDRAIERFTEAGKRTRDPFLRAEIFNDQARTHLEKGERDQALLLLERAEKSFTRATRGRLGVPERIFLASLLRNRGSVFHRRGEFKEAIGFYEKALELVADESEPRFRKSRAMLLNSIGLSHMKAFRLEESLGFFRRALELARSVGDARTEVHVRNNLGVVANDMGNNREALATLTEQHDALEMLVGETRELAALKFNIGESFMFMENFAEAEPWYRRALAIGEKIGYREFVVGTRYNLAELLHKLNRTGEALQVLDPALTLARDGGWKLQQMDVANLLGEIHRDLGEWQAARECHSQALNLAGQLGDDFGRSWALRNLAVDLQTDPAAGEQEKAGC
ncbi:MAG TPA: tetratricopeptide repeat protein, partial [Candidatus Glassbacteria bacterium]|nr:tetratricopeptide repeat protein [Candidatus Glassbacteria bacterium]